MTRPAEVEKRKRPQLPVLPFPEKVMQADRYRLRRSWARLLENGDVTTLPDPVKQAVDSAEWMLDPKHWSEVCQALGQSPGKVNEGRVNEGRGQSRSKNPKTRLFDWLSRCRQSVELQRWRQQNGPNYQFDGTLPVHAHVSKIRQAIEENQVVVVCGETGSGKSTQLPKICLEAGLGKTGFVGHTQPRRIAARSVAARLADEMSGKLGEAVGYKIRFHDDTNEKTFVKLMTDGILLAETQGDRFLDRYDAIILDEAHERSLNIDFLLGYLKRVLERRPEFRLIITSATIDAERFAKHFANRDGQAAPVIQVEGRGFPVEIQYQSPELEDGSWINQEQSIIRAIEELSTIDRGHILVFLPTERDILSMSRKLRNLRLGRSGSEQTEVVPLYARLGVKEQQQIFQPTAQRRIVLATNVAESSLTVPGIKYVVDTGTARISRYSARSKVQRLPIEAISQASANQRAGRCGRVGPGVCVRLYSEQDFQQRDPFTTPEIRRTNLASVILQAKMLNLGPLEAFPFIDPPRPEAVAEGNRSLFEIGAIDEQGDLTEIGRKLGQLPIDPRIGRMIIEAAEHGVVDQVLIIAAALEVQDPRVRPIEMADAADQAHAQFQDKRSDFLSYLKVWNFYHETKEQRSRAVLRKKLHANFISPERMQQWLDVHRQLRLMVRDLKLPRSNQQENYAAIHRSLLAGLLSGVAMLDEKEPKLKRYLGAANVRFQLWPGSGLDRLPKWVMVGEIVETSRNFGRNVAAIETSWVEPLAKHLVKHRYSQPRWNPKSCGVTANQRVTLFGLPIVAKRRVPFGKIDPKECRLLMFSEGFFVGAWEQPAPDFLQHNWELQNSLKDLGQKTRKLTWIVDEQRVVEFYDQRIPLDVVDAPTLNRFLKDADDSTQRSLLMKAADIVSQVDDYRPEDYPAVLDLGIAKLPLTYRFEPGEEQDGVFVKVPLEVLGQVHDQRLTWAIPGWVEAKVAQMIKSLPKAIRRNLVPAPDTAREVAAAMKFGEGSFIQEVASRLSAIAELPINPEDFELERLDPYLKMGIEVTDAEGAVVAQGRSLGEVRSKLKDRGISTSSQIQDEVLQLSGKRDWEFGNIPLSVKIPRGELTVEAFPGLLDEGESVGLRMFDTRAAAQRYHQEGMIRLFALQHRKSLRGQLNWLPGLDRSRLLLSRWISGAELDESLIWLMVRIGLVEGQSEIRNAVEFERRKQNATSGVAMAAAEVAKWLPLLSEAVHHVDNRLADLKSNMRLVKPFNDARTQVRSLLRKDFLKTTAWEWLQQFPRYLAGMEYRLSRLTAGSVAQDVEKIEMLEPYWERYEQHRLWLENHDRVDPQLEQFRWMLEEYRISLFAQPLGTQLKVSPKRLERQWDQVLPIH